VTVARDKWNYPGRGYIDITDLTNANLMAFLQFESDGYITEYPIIEILSDPIKFKKYAFKRSNCSFTTTSTHDEKAQTIFYTTEVLCQFNKMNKNKRYELEKLVRGQTYLVLQDWDDIFWLVGYDSYVSGSVVAASGSEFSDANAYSLTLNSLTKEIPYTLEWNEYFIQSDILE